MLAVESGNLAAADLLIANGANIDIKTVSIIVLYPIFISLNTYKISLTLSRSFIYPYPGRKYHCSIIDP